MNEAIAMAASNWTNWIFACSVVFFTMFAAALSGCGSEKKPPALPEGIDHLVYAAADLERGMDEIEQKLGVRPIIGGRHPDYGTHNALLSLGPTTYLEVIAPDPELPVPARGLPFDLASRLEPGLVTWVLRTETIEATVARAAAEGLDLGSVLSGSRERPDGSMLSWKLTDPYAMRHSGTVPFLISWGETPHPAATTPRAGELIGFRIEHPQSERVREALAALGVTMQVSSAEHVRLVARIRTATGDVELD